MDSRFFLGSDRDVDNGCIDDSKIPRNDHEAFSFNSLQYQRVESLNPQHNRYPGHDASVCRYYDILSISVDQEKCSVAQGSLP